MNGQRPWKPDPVSVVAWSVVIGVTLGFWLAVFIVLHSR